MAALVAAGLTGLALLCQVGAPEAAGAEAPRPVVRHVELDRRPIFSPADQERLPWLPLDLVNRVHVDTRESVIRRELVFSEGEPLDLDELEESERKLRETNFFSEVEITTRSVAPDSVDVVVRTRELWTAAIDVSYKSFEGEKLWGMRVRERNFLGSARSFEVARDVDLDRSTWTLGAGDRQLFGGKWRARGLWSNADDGEAVAWSLNRPFFELTDDWQLLSSYYHGGSKPRFYVSRDRYLRPQADLTNFDLSVLRRLRTTHGAVWRGGLGFELSHQRFEAERPLTVYDVRGETGDRRAIEADPQENRRWRIPYLMFELQTRRYQQTRYLFAMGAVEDIPIGPQLDVRVGWATRALDSTESGLYFDVDHQWFFRRGSGFDRFFWSFDGLYRDGGAEDTRVRAQWSSYRFFGQSYTWGASVLGMAGSELDRQNVFTLGLESGLRAARFRELAGDRVFRANTELRWVYRPGILDLVTPGVTMFADVGSAWFEEDRDLSWGELRGAIGTGLRLGFNRAANEVPIRVDLAWPLLYPSDQSRPVLSIGTGHVF